VRRRITEARVAVEAPPGAQAEEDLARAPLELALQLDGVLAGIEDEQGNRELFSSEPAEQGLHLPGGDHVGVLGGPDALHIHGGAPTLAGEVDSGDELLGPACDDGLPR
jgi:hypothetical protein